MIVDISKIQIGTILPDLQKQISQEEINLYAKASHDFNPIHIDPEFARKTAAGGTIAHGMLVLAYVSQSMTANFGINWLTGGRLNIRFKAPARPGDTVTIQSKVNKIQKNDHSTMVSCDIACTNQQGEAVITGEAIVRVRENENSH